MLDLWFLAADGGRTLDPVPGYLGPGVTINTPSQETRINRGLGFVQKDGSHFLVMVARMVLGEVISQVDCAGRPVNFELLLVGAIMDPIETHIDRLRSVLFYFTIDNTVGGGVIGADGGWWLRMSQFLGGCA